MSAPPRALTLAAGQRQDPVQTTDATPTPVFVRTLDDDTAYLIAATVVARDSTGTDHNAYQVQAQAYRSGGGAATLGPFGSISLYTDESDLDWAVEVQVSGNDAQVVVTGEAARTIDWGSVVTMHSVA